MIPTRVDVFLSNDIGINNNYNENDYNSNYDVWKFVGFFCLNDNERSKWVAREFKKVTIHQTITRYLRFQFSDAYKTPSNVYYQSAIISIIPIGAACYTPRLSSLPEILADLANAKRDAILNEKFAEAELISIQIENISRNMDAIKELLDRKSEALLGEEFRALDSINKRIISIMNGNFNRQQNQTSSYPNNNNSMNQFPQRQTSNQIRQVNCNPTQNLNQENPKNDDNLFVTKDENVTPPLIANSHISPSNEPQQEKQKPNENQDNKNKYNEIEETQKKKTNETKKKSKNKSKTDENSEEDQEESENDDEDDSEEEEKVQKKKPKKELKPAKQEDEIKKPEPGKSPPPRNRNSNSPKVEIDPLSDEARRESSYLVELFGESPIAEVYSEAWSLKVSGYTKICKLIKGIKDNDQKAAAFQAFNPITLNLLRCPLKAVFVNTATNITSLIDDIKEALHPGIIGNAASHTLLHPALSKLGETNSRISETALNLVKWCVRKDRIAAAEVINFCSQTNQNNRNELKSSRSEPASLLLKKLDLIETIAKENEKLLLSKLTASDAMSLIVPCIESAKIEVRQKAIEVFVLLYSLYGRKLEKYLANVPRLTKEQVLAAVANK